MRKILIHLFFIMSAVSNLYSDDMLIVTPRIGDTIDTYQTVRNQCGIKITVSGINLKKGEVLALYALLDGGDKYWITGG